MAFDARRGVTVLFGGRPLAGGVPLGDTWEWNGVAWVERAGDEPPARLGAAMAFHEARACTMLFGGYPNRDDTWVLRSCGTADFDHDGSVGTDADIEAFFACLAGNCCATCDTADFNNDGDVGTDADIEAFFMVLAGHTC
jgi:hypothetical protein